MQKFNRFFLFFLIFDFQLNSAELKTEKEKKSLNVVHYKVQENLKPKNLFGISNEQIEEHWKLYKGYVEQVNKLNKELTELRQGNEGNSLDYADRRRRFGFEYNGMVLHELYFGNLKKQLKEQKPNTTLLKAIENSFGTYDKWLNDFVAAGKTRGIGWAILTVDPVNNNLINLFIADHEIGHIATFSPVLVMDVWEHAYMVDYGATERVEYINAFVKNINWDIVQKRFDDIQRNMK